MPKFIIFVNLWGFTEGGLMNYAVDLGNTSAKCGIFKGDNLIDKLDNLKITQVIEIINKNLPSNVIFASVNQDVAKLSQHIDKYVNCLVLDHQIKTPINNQYDTKETLGLDRLAGVVGANYLFPKKNLLTIDAGTCITYDIVNNNREYQGGAISPGIEMKFRALHDYTARLPHISIDQDVDLIGKSTRASMLSGVLNGTVAEITQMIRMYASEFVDLQIVICGGDSQFLKSKLSTNVTFMADLVLIGLNRILRYNVKGI